MADFYDTGKQPKNQESKELGKHIGACSGKDVEGDPCGFSLLADTDAHCPKCGTPIKER